MMHRLSLLSSLFISLLASNGNAQQTYNKTPEFLKTNGVWVTPDSVGLNFNDRTNFEFKTAMGVGATHLREGCASVADPQTGALLFYSDGGQCWNKNNVVMPNGSRLLGNSGGILYGGGTLSTTQGVCIVPFINEPGKYYLFSLGSIRHLEDPGAAKLYYSVVDMNLNNGLGDIVSGQKNILLDSARLSESMVAVPGCNNDIWLIIHAMDSAIFKSYHITGSGIDINPLLSYTGAEIQGETKVLISNSTFTFSQKAYLTGSMKVAPDRTRLAITCTNMAYSGLFGSTIYPSELTVGTLLCDFNASTGMVSNAVLIDTFGGYDIAFSQDNSKLYVHSGYHMYQPFGIFQFDLSVMDSTAIVNSKTRIAQVSTTFGFSQMKLYNDTIYVKNGTTIDRINSPHLLGAACNYQANAIAFPFLQTSLSPSLPNDVVLPFRPDTIFNTIDTTICSGWVSGIILTPELSTDDYVYEWSDHSVGSTLKVTESGTYWVKYNNGCQYRIDTFILMGSDLDPVISVTGFDLNTTETYSTYQWMLDGNPIPNATSKIYTATQNGDYQVVVSDGICTDTSAVYEVRNVTAINEVNVAASIRIYPNPAYDQIQIQSPTIVHAAIINMDGKELLRQSDARVIDISSLTAGMYILRITDRNNAVLKNDKLIKLK